MAGQSVPCHLLPRSAFFAIVTVWIDGNPPSWKEFAPHLYVFGIHEPDQVIHDDIHTVFMKIPMIAEAEQIEFQRLALYHPLRRHIGNIQGGKIRLSRDGTETCEFRTVKLDKIIPVRMFVWKCF